MYTVPGLDIAIDSRGGQVLVGGVRSLRTTAPLPENRPGGPAVFGSCCGECGQIGGCVGSESLMVGGAGSAMSPLEISLLLGGAAAFFLVIGSVRK